jgi:hypothetical protein
MRPRPVALVPRLQLTASGKPDARATLRAFAPELLT